MKSRFLLLIILGVFLLLPKGVFAQEYTFEIVSLSEPSLDLNNSIYSFDFYAYSDIIAVPPEDDPEGRPE